MEGYPVHYVTHNVPLIALSGLGAAEPIAGDEVEHDYSLLQDRGIRISCDLPDVTGAAGEDLLGCFRDFDARNAAWNNRPGKGKMGTMGFTFRSVGRSVLLPPHKAAPPEAFQDFEGNESRSSLTTPALHSPLSPLTPSSPTFPDGIMTPLWFSKHQLFLPSALISFFNFTVDYDRSTLQDNVLKNEIISLKSSVSASGYKFRLVIVLVAEDEGINADVEDRVVNIRKATVMDPKSLYWLPCNTSIVQMKAFIGTILSNLQPTCIEYYRDLSKHARRKKNRGATPPPTAPPISGTSQTLSTQGWNIRYDTKLGFFAEFRQEMDAAGRSYESAYENLLEGEILETVASWSPAFSDIRLLADILALRILRCLLWAGQHTSAVQSWSNHRSRIRDLVDRRGKGSQTYGWKAWDARWSSVMAELIEKVDLPIFQVPESLEHSQPLMAAPAIFAPAERSFSNEPRIPPWDLLHHPGYWWKRSAGHTRARRQLAIGIPEEDRIRPSQSSDSVVAGAAHRYDTYLCPEPYIEHGLPGSKSFDHSTLLVKTLKSAAHHYSIRSQLRASEQASLEIGQEHMAAGRFQEAMDTLKPIWKILSWRRDGWWNLVSQVSWSIRDCAKKIGDWETLVAAEWELLSSLLPPKKDWTYDFSQCLASFDTRGKVFVAFNSENTAPTLSAHFAFAKPTGNVGLAETAQLSVETHMRSTSAPIVLSYIDVHFMGGLRAIRINHDPSKEALPVGAAKGVDYFDVTFKETPSLSDISSPVTETNRNIPKATGSADLTFRPGRNKVFCLKLLPREAVEVRATEAIIMIEQPSLEFELNLPLRNLPLGAKWWAPIDGELAWKKLSYENHSSILIEPKPPKVRLSMPKFRSAYYINERVRIQIVLFNGEDDVADIRVNVSLFGSGETTPTLDWWTEEHEFSEALTLAPASRLEDHEVGQIAPGQTAERWITFRAPPEMAEFGLVVRANYVVSSDLETPLTTEIKEKVHLIGPFEATFNYRPRVHPEPWPSYFLLSEGQQSSDLRGLKQRWALEAKITSFAMEPLLIQETKLQLLETKYAVATQLETADQPNGVTLIHPNEQLERPFRFDIQKATLEDRRAAISSGRLNIAWAREDEPERQNTLSLLLPALTVVFGEPRVLVAAEESGQVDNMPLLKVTYTLENPSSHFLSFSLTMETNEEFAFSGPKTTSTQLVPLSRHEVRYNLLPMRRGVWIRPVLRVIDTGFGQELRVHATDGCREDKRAVAIWVPE